MARKGKRKYQAQYDEAVQRFKRSRFAKLMGPSTLDIKRENTTFTNVAMLTAGAALEYTDIDSGVAESERIGNLITVNKIQGMLHFRQASAGTTQKLFRISVLQSKQGNLSSFPSVVGPCDTDKYWVLYDYIGGLCRQVSGGGGDSGHTIKFSCNAKAKNIRYIDSTGANAKNHPIYMAFITDNVDGAGAEINGWTRITYVG